MKHHVREEHSNKQPRKKTNQTGIRKRQNEDTANDNTDEIVILESSEETEISCSENDTDNKENTAGEEESQSNSSPQAPSCSRNRSFIQIQCPHCDFSSITDGAMKKHLYKFHRSSLVWERTE